jgi:hypothetical protein
MKNTFAFAVEKLINNGFELASTEYWNESQGTVGKVFIHPVHHVLFLIIGFEKDKVLLSQVYFSWKPRSVIAFKVIEAKAHFAYLGELNRFLNPDHSLNTSYLGFPLVQSCFFQHIWKFYKLVKKHGDFLSWQPESPVDLISYDVNRTFVYDFPLIEGSFSKTDLLNTIQGYISQQSRLKATEISNVKLHRMLSKLKLSPQNYGLQ